MTKEIEISGKALLPINRFDEVSTLEFYTYLEDIKNRLKNEAPEWHVNVYNTPSPIRTLYHCCRFDFTKPEIKWPIRIAEHIFAYTEDDKHFLFNHHPLN